MGKIAPPTRKAMKLEYQREKVRHKAREKQQRQTCLMSGSCGWSIMIKW